MNQTPLEQIKAALEQMKEIELPDDVEVKKVPFTYSRHFMGMNHNYVCSVCKARSAVQDCHTGILQPCWECISKGYRLLRLNWFHRLFFKDLK